MLREILTHPGALLIAIGIHLLLIMVFIFSFHWQTPPSAQEIGIPIEFIQKMPLLKKNQKTVIGKTDTQEKKQTVKNLSKQNIISPTIQNNSNNFAKKKLKQTQLLVKKKAKEEAKKKAEQARRAKLLAEKKAKEEAEKRKIAEAKAKKEARDKKIREAALKKWQEKKRLEKEQKLAAERKAKEEAEKKKQAAILAREKALQQKIAAEKERLSAAAKRKAQSDWSNKIGTYVKRRWQIPPGTSGMSAVIRITVSPSGYIRGPIEIIRCAHPSFCDSIKQAYKNSEPLPRPTRNDLDRTLRITMEAK